MSLKEKNKSRQSNWTNLPKENKIRLNFNKKHNNNSFYTIDYLESQYNFNKMIQKKKPPQLLREIRSSSTTSNFFQNKNMKNSKNSLVFYPLNIKIAALNKTNKNIDKKNNKKSPTDIIKIPKTNLNNNKQKINYGTIKINTNKNKDNTNINYLLSACNLSAKNINSGIFKRKIKEKRNNNGSTYNNLSNSITYININKVFPLNSNSNIMRNNIVTNININKNNRYEEAKKEQEKLNELLEEKNKYSERINEKIKDLQCKNKILMLKINKIGKENDNYASTLDKIIKLIKLLKNNGFDVADIIKNLSVYDNEESNEEEEIEENKDFSFGKEGNENNKIKNDEEFSFKNNKKKI